MPGEICERCLYQAVTQKSWISAPKLNCTHGVYHKQPGFVLAVMSCLTSFPLHNVHFLPAKAHRKWHPSLTRKRASSRKFSQPGLFVSLSGNRSRFPVCVMSNQQTSSEGKAVITNKLLLMKLSLTMWSDQCAAQSWNNIITLRRQSSGLSVSLGFSLTSLRTTPSSRLFSTSHTLLIK